MLKLPCSPPKAMVPKLARSLRVGGGCMAHDGRQSSRFDTKVRWTGTGRGSEVGGDDDYQLSRSFSRRGMKGDVML